MSSMVISVKIVGDRRQNRNMISVDLLIRYDKVM
jgi:hypothetical protein